MNKRVKEMRRVLGIPDDYQLEHLHASGHFRILTPDGKVLRTEYGVPITVCNSPSDVRTRKNEAARIRRALR